MIRSTFCCSTDGSEIKIASPEDMVQALQRTDGFLWVSLENANDAELISILRDCFHFHPLAIEDCQSSGYQTPKVDDFNRYIFIVVHAICFNSDLTELETTELNFFLGQNYLVTCFTEGTVLPIKSTWQRITKDERLRLRGADFLCHSIIDRLVDDFMPLLEQMDDEIEVLEDQVLNNPTPDILERVLMLKHHILMLRRIIGPQRETINRLSRDDFHQIDQQSKIYFRDIYDHLVRIQDLIESIRDVVSSVLDIYLSSTSLRLNEVMKALTIVSTIFLPLSFVAGVYGMNFEFIPELSWPYGYVMVWGVFIAIAVVMLLFFKRRGWF